MAYVESLPVDRRSHLEHVLDWNHGGLDSDLIEISQHMLDWEELAIPLNLSAADVSSIKTQYGPPMHRYGCFKALTMAPIVRFMCIDKRH